MSADLLRARVTALLRRALAPLQSGWLSFAGWLERACLALPPLLEPSPLARLRMVPLVWTLAVSELAGAAVAVYTHSQGRVVLALLALALAGVAGTTLTRLRGITDPPRWLVVVALLLTLGTALAIDLAIGGSGQCAAISLPLCLWLAGLYLPRPEASAFGLMAIGALLIDLVLGSHPGPAASNLLFLPYPLLHACVLGTRTARARREVHTTAQYARVTIQSLHQLEQRELQRFVDFNAMSGSWYWETDADLNLQFVASGLLERLGSVNGNALGRTLISLIRQAHPNVIGLYEVTHAMTYELGIRGRRIMWLDAAGNPAIVKLDAWPAYTAYGEFRGYRGRVSDANFGTAIASDRRRISGQTPIFTPREQVRPETSMEAGG